MSQKKPSCRVSKVGKVDLDYLSYLKTNTTRTVEMWFSSRVDQK